MPTTFTSFFGLTAPSCSMEKTTSTTSCPPPPQSSWEDMEYGGLSVAGLPEGVVVKNTFINYPNVRSTSLDEYAQENSRGWTSCPASGIMEQELQSPQNQPSELQRRLIQEQESASSKAGDDASSTHPEEEEKELGELPKGVVVKNTFIDYPTVRSTSLDEYIEDRGWKSCPVSRMQSEAENQVSEIQAAVIREAEESLSGNSSDREEEEEEKKTLRLLELLPRPEPVFSVGSVPHQMGQPCKPCGFVHKPEGCSNGAQCQYCHLCPPGTIKQRKKVKKVMIHQVWQQRQQHQGGWY